MKETLEELLKHTRRELEGMAEKHGITVAGLSKARLAESIIEARKKAELKVKAPAKEKTMVDIRKTGVLAKRDDVLAQRAANEEKAREIQKGVDEMHTSVIMLQKNIAAQIKENEKAAAKIHTGVKQMQSDVKVMQSAILEMHFDMDKKARAIVQSGSEQLQKGVAQMQDGIKEVQTGIREFQNDTANYIKDFYYG